MRDFVRKKIIESNSTRNSRYAFPTWVCGLICLAGKRNLDVQLRQTGTTGKSLKTCPALRAKIFCFRSQPNQLHNSACLTADEGRWPSSRTRGEMRWTQELRLTCAAQAYGELVWFGRRGAGAKSGRGNASLVATEAKEPFSGKSTK